MKNAIYRTDLGTSTARPVKGVLEISDLPEDDFAVRLADQVALLEANEAIIEIGAGEAFSDLDDDEDTYDYTVNPTATPPVALTPITIDRYSLSQKQARVRQIRDLLIAEAIIASNYDRFISDADLGTFATYISSLRSISDSEASPDTVVFPTLGGIAGAGDRVLTRQYRRSNIIGAVGQSSGIPTGEIFETATTVNGLYYRTTDGFQVCRTRLAASYFSNQRLLASWTLPAAFIAASAYSVELTFSQRNTANTVVGLTDAEIRQCQMMLNSRSATAIDIQVMSPTFAFSAGDVVWLDAVAIGRCFS